MLRHSELRLARVTFGHRASAFTRRSPIVVASDFYLPEKRMILARYESYTRIVTQPLCALRPARLEGAREGARRGGIGPYPVVSPRIPYISLYPVVSRTGYCEKNRPGEGCLVNLGSDEKMGDKKQTDRQTNRLRSKREPPRSQYARC